MTIESRRDILKTSISVTLSQTELDIITKDAVEHNRSLSSEIGYLIRHQKYSEDTFKTIFKELAELKKSVQERFQ